MGVADPLGTQVAGGDGGRKAGTEVAARDGGVRARHGMPEDAIVLAAFGGMTPEKRIGPLLRALSALADRHPRLCT